MFDGAAVICFDLDDTFWDVQSVLERAEDRVHEFLTRRYPRLAAAHSRESFLQQRLRLAGLEPARAHDLTWLRTETMRRLALEHGYADHVGREAFEVFIEARNQVEIFPDVQPALARLRARYRLATFSNGNADLERIGLAAQFVLSLNSEQVGFAKPDPRAFHAVARQLGVLPAAIIYVGDDPLNDVEGPRSAGLRPVWLNRLHSDWPESFARAELEVRDLRELARHVLADERL